MPDYDVAIVGGGLLGAAFAYGLAGPTCRVLVVDEHDHAIRTARGNFGLVWVQGKGHGMAQYARWSVAAARAWPALAERLREETGIDVCLRQPGGFEVATSEQALAEHLAVLEDLRRAAGAEGYDFEVVQRPALERYLPGIGADVAGATYCPHDGHLNPLKLLRALHEGLQRNGGTYLPGRTVQRVAPLAGGGFELFAEGAPALASAARLVIAAGHGSVDLARQVDLAVPVLPVQGQVVVTERAASVLHYPTNYVRQTDEGTFLLGASARDVGFDLDTESTTLRDIARQCTSAFPYLRTLRVQRAWAALRIMTPDGFPVYAQSSTWPGAFVFVCHSGVTLASLHATQAAQWVLDGTIPEAQRCFHPGRFDVQASRAAG